MESCCATYKQSKIKDLQKPKPKPKERQILEL